MIQGAVTLYDNYLWLRTDSDSGGKDKETKSKNNMQIEILQRQSYFYFDTYVAFKYCCLHQRALTSWNWNWQATRLLYPTEKV